MLKPIYRFSKKGIALVLVFVVFSLLSILVISMLSLQKTRGTAVVKEGHTLACEFALESALEACFAGISREGLVWGQDDGVIEHSLKDDEGVVRSSYRLEVVPMSSSVVPDGSSTAEVWLNDDQSYMNFSLAPVSVKIQDSETGQSLESFALSPFHGLLVVDASVGLLASKRARVIVDVKESAASVLDAFPYFTPRGDLWCAGKLDIAKLDEVGLNEEGQIDSEGPKDPRGSSSTGGSSGTSTNAGGVTGGTWTPPASTGNGNDDGIKEYLTKFLGEELRSDGDWLEKDKKYTVDGAVLRFNHGRIQLGQEGDRDDVVLGLQVEDIEVLNKEFSDYPQGEKSDIHSVLSDYTQKALEPGTDGSVPARLRGTIRMAGEESTARVDSKLKDTTVEYQARELKNLFASLELDKEIETAKVDSIDLVKYIKETPLGDDGKLVLEPSKSYYYDESETAEKDRLSAKKLDIALNEAKLYVKGDLELNGHVAGKGSVYVGGTTTLRKNVSLASEEDEVALFGKGNIYLLKGDSTEDIAELLGEGSGARVRDSLKRLEATSAVLNREKNLLESASAEAQGKEGRSEAQYESYFKEIARGRSSIENALIPNQNFDSFGENGGMASDGGSGHRYLRESDYVLLRDRLSDLPSSVDSKAREDALRTIDSIVVGVHPQLFQQVEGNSWWQLSDKNASVDQRVLRDARDEINFVRREYKRYLRGEGGIFSDYWLSSGQNRYAKRSFERYLGAYVPLLNTERGHASFRGVLCSQEGMVFSQKPLHVIGMIVADKGLVCSDDLAIRADSVLFKSVFQNQFFNDEVIVWLP